VEGEIGDDAKPAEESGELGIESGFNKTGGEGLVLEVEWDEGEIGGVKQVCFGKHFFFPDLRCGEIDFKDAKSWEWVAPGKRVEPGAEDDVLG
jgi:hypothetical protein